MKKNKWLTKVFLSALWLIFCNVIVFGQATSYDWTEKIQLYGHGYKVPTQFTSAQLDTIANMFKIFTVEKRHAYNSYGGNPSSERAAQATADSIKVRNPNVKVLLYWNSVMNYSTLYESNIEFNAHPEWVYSIWNTGYEIYDLTNPDCQDWWVNSIVNTIRESSLDGVFLDAGPKVYSLGLTDAYNSAVDRVRDSLGNDKIIIYNGFRVNGANSIQAGQDYIEHQSGVYIEFFLRTPCDTKDEVAFLFDNLIEAYNNGKMIIPRGTPLHYLEGAEDPLLFNFASFLLFYGPKSYYCYNLNGYSVDDGMFSYFPEYYDIATGKSLSGPKRNGYVYTREFENISVKVDLENVTAEIIHKEVSTPVDSSDIIDSSLVNIALNGTATQSSTNYGGVASRAIDGNRSGAWVDRSVTHTNEEQSPWWQVDLGAEHSIGVINIFGRTDSTTMARLSDYNLYVLDHSGNITYSKHFTTYPNVTTDAMGATGQYIKIVLNDSTALSLAEVEVYEYNAPSTEITTLSPLKEDAITIYPNPVSKKLIINSLLNGEIILYDFCGNAIMKLHKNENDISSLSTGLYFVVIKKEDKNIAVKSFYKSK